MMWEYVNQFGAPRHIYTDRGSVFYAENQLTDFTRAMQELGCRAIYAKTPQAKGRVERGNRTFQDRLVKAMRENNISRIGEANKFLSERFICMHNEKFSLNTDAPDVHYEVKEYDLKNIFCYKTDRHIRNDYTITLDGVYIQLLKGEVPLPCPRQIVQVHKWLDNTLHILHHEHELSYKVLEAKPSPSKRLPIKPRKDHPWKIKNHRMVERKSWSHGATA
jgi:hypothetical protein